MRAQDLPKSGNRFAERRSCARKHFPRTTRAHASFRRRTTTRAAARIDMLVLHYTGMTTEEEALRAAGRPEARVVLALLRLRGRPRRSARAGGAPRLARGRIVMGRRHRHQFALDRHRDRQPRPRIRLPRFSRSADRGHDRALPRHPCAPHHPAPSACWRIRTSHRRARTIRARSFRGRGSPPQASACGSSPRRSSRAACSPRRSRRRSRGACSAALARFGYAAEVTRIYDDADARAS